MKTVYYSLAEREVAPHVVEAKMASVDPLKSIGAERYLALMRAQTGTCYLCRRLFDKKHRPTVDHVNPRARGGIITDNVLLACFPCNQRKADREPKPSELDLLRRVNEHITKEAKGSVFGPLMVDKVQKRVSVFCHDKPRRMALIERMRSL